MKNLFYGIACLVIGLVLTGVGFNELTSHDVTCGDRVMHQGDSCEHISRRGHPSTNDYGGEKSAGKRAGVVLLVVGPLMALGGVFFLQDAVRARRRAAARVPAPMPGPLPWGNAPALLPGDAPPQQARGPTDAAFTHPIELPCVLDADVVMKRMIPMLVVLAVVIWLVVAVAVGMMVPDVAAVSAGTATVVAATIVIGSYVYKRNRLRRVYGQMQRLIVHPGGLRRFDPWVVIDIPWTGIARVEWRNSSLPPAGRARIMIPAAAVAVAATRQAHTVMAFGIVGQGSIAPLPGASRRMLQFQDQLYGSDLDGGHPHHSRNCLIFPGEFEKHWTTGVVGAWLRHYRPDLALPADS